jgi:hypothetical protein
VCAGSKQQHQWSETMAAPGALDNTNKGNYLLRDVQGKEAFESTEQKLEKEHRLESKGSYARSETVPEGPGDRKPNHAIAEMTKPAVGKHGEVMMKDFHVTGPDKAVSRTTADSFDARFASKPDHVGRGDSSQKWVNDLGIEPVKTIDQLPVNSTTGKVDKALEHADPKAYNCNGYVQLNVLNWEGKDAGQLVKDKNLMHENSWNPLDKAYNDRTIDKNVEAFYHLGDMSMTGSPEGFLKDHRFKSAEQATGDHAVSKLAQQGKLREGDVIVSHSKDGEHSAVVVRDPETGALVTSQKPNSVDKPVRLTFDQFDRAEMKSAGSRVAVYRNENLVHAEK